MARSRHGSCDFLSFDYASAGEQIRRLGSQRAESAVFANAVCALYFKAKHDSLSASLLFACLGPPDCHETGASGADIHQYNWVGFNSIESNTRFVVLDGQVTEVEGQQPA